MMGSVGSATPRWDADAKVRGEAVYAVDNDHPGTLHAKLLRSPVPAGVIRRLDVTTASQMPGVHRILTAVHAPERRVGAIVADQLLFAADLVRYEGEPIAGVVADTPEHAQAAVRAIAIEIEPTQAVGDLEDALAAGAPLVHPDWQSYVQSVASDFVRGGNIAAEMVSNPDPDALHAAFSAADLVVEGEYRAGRQYQAYLEPKSALAVYENGRYVVRTASQFPFNVQLQTAEFLGVRQSDVRIVGDHIGGGFGAKLDAALEPYAALFAHAVRRPVKLVNDRVEDLLTCGSRENAIVRLRTALSSDGTILARELECLMDNGAYCGEMPLMTSLPMHVLGQVYRTGPAYVLGRLVYTNTAPTGAFRGVSGTYLYFAVERHMDECAARLGIDRREIRLKNLIGDGDKSLTGQVLEEAGILREAFSAAEKVAPWRAVTKTPPRTGMLRGVGIAAATWLTNPAAGSVVMKLNEDGTVGLVTAATENGSGAVTMGVTQIAADELGLRPDQVVVTMPDTDLAPFDGGSQGSRTTHIVGRATRIAGAELSQKLRRVAAGMLEASEEDLELRDGGVVVKGSPATSVTLKEVAATALATTGPLAATGSYTTVLPSHDPQSAAGLLLPTFPTPTYHVHLAEVEVDPNLGLVDVIRYLVVQEVGKVINPVGVRGQVQGAVTQGLGYALYETLEIVGARYQQRTLESYRLPLAVDVPDVEFVLLEHPEAEGPHGARGVGEPPIVPVAAAIGNAVSDALGRPINRLPIRPDDILEALADLSPHENLAGTRGVP